MRARNGIRKFQRPILLRQACRVETDIKIEEPRNMLPSRYVIILVFPGNKPTQRWCREYLRYDIGNKMKYSNILTSSCRIFFLYFFSNMRVIFFFFWSSRQIFWFTTFFWAGFFTSGFWGTTVFFAVVLAGMFDVFRSRFFDYHFSLLSQWQLELPTFAATGAFLLKYSFLYLFFIYRYLEKEFSKSKKREREGLHKRQWSLIQG